MQNIITYLIESVVCSGIFAIYYLCFLHSGRFFRYNRAYLLSAALLSIIIPLVHITFHVDVPVIYEESVATVYRTAVEMPAQAAQFDYSLVLWALYLLPVIFMFGFELKIYLKLRAMKRNARQFKINEINVYNVDSEDAPFSFFNSIFWKSNIDINSSGGQRIFLHELAHVRAGHSYDKLLMQLLCTVFWMNPVLRIFKRELSIVHEYAADNACIADNNTGELSELILCSLYPNVYSGFANRFFQSSIKKRIVMMTKSQKSKFSFIRKTMVIPLIFMMLYMFAVDIKAKPVPVYIPTPVPAVDAVETVEAVDVADTLTKKSKNVKSKDAVVVVGYGSQKKAKDSLSKNIKVKVFQGCDTAKITLGKHIIIPNQHLNGEIKRIVFGGDTLQGKLWYHSGDTADINFVFDTDKPMILLDNRQITETELNDLDIKKVQSFEILKDNAAVKIFGEQGKSGVIIIRTYKDGFLHEKSLKIEKEQKISSKLEELFADDDNVSFFIDKKKITKEEFEKLNTEEIESFEIFKDEAKIEAYGEKGKRGLIIVHLKKK